MSTVSDYPIQPVSFERVAVTDHFWAPRIQTDVETTIPFALNSLEETGRVRNFDIAARRDTGSFCTTYPFDDSDVFKVIEAASYALRIAPDPALERRLDSLIERVSAAQEPDGYLYTNRTIDPDNAHPWAGTQRWERTHELSHELYNAGHLYEAAVAHFLATGKRTLLNVAIRNADLVDHDFGPGKIERVPGHQVIEMGLTRLFRVTGEQRYLDLACFFLDARGPGADPYSQAHERVVDQRTAVGHAVRAAYMYSGMADVAALTGDTAYEAAVESIWHDVVNTKLYLTGGIGNRGEIEGFGESYDLPNEEAYSETCASIANVFWNHRMFLSTGDGKYLDVLERTLYNALLSGVSLSGDRFFYPNPLASDGSHLRQPWFGCACCPSNISRFLPSVPGYVYAHNNNTLFVSLFVTSSAEIRVGDTTVQVEQASRYPWDGDIAIFVRPERPVRFTVSVRVPGWTRNQPVPGDLYRYADNLDSTYSISVNGKAVDVAVVEGFAHLQRDWRADDTVRLHLPMPVRTVVSHENVVRNRGRLALQKGPLVYAVEEIDLESGDISDVTLSAKTSFVAAHKPELLRGVDVITATSNSSSFRAIPYYAWANREPAPMRVWIPSVTEMP
jgi:DUF1680 family protein